MKYLKLIFKIIRILLQRIRKQGLITTVVWLYARGVPIVTGVPILKYSKITDKIYIGPQYGKAGKTRLEAEGIHNSVNMRIEYDDAENGLALDNYCYLPTVDDDAPTPEHLEEGVAFIRNAIEADGKVYIHCAGGIGRAPTIAAAYFIHSGMSLDEALHLIRQTRPFINIMPVQMVALKEYEKQQRETVGSNSV
ncbi:MAG: dual specificity protein phosphatase [Aggregatilineales bacterium]